MPSATIAILDGTDLPIQFSYAPVVPRKRFRVFQTATGVRVHSNETPVGEGQISWTIEGATQNEFKLMIDFYLNDNGNGYKFTGYWGDESTVRCLMWDNPVVRATNFALSGVFDVVEVVSFGELEP